MTALIPDKIDFRVKTNTKKREMFNLQPYIKQRERERIGNAR